MFKCAEIVYYDWILFSKRSSPLWGLSCLIGTLNVLQSVQGSTYYTIKLRKQLLSNLYKLCSIVYICIMHRCMQELDSKKPTCIYFQLQSGMLHVYIHVHPWVKCIPCYMLSPAITKRTVEANKICFYWHMYLQFCF